MNSYIRQCLWALPVTLAFCSPAFASNGISGLYNTGVNNSGNVLANGAQDSHYSLNSNGANSSNNPLTGLSTPYASSSGWPISNSSGGSGTSGQWLGADIASSWLTLFSTPGVTLDPVTNGIYTFTTTFTINTGYNPLTALISGQWASDNYSQMYLNGNLVASIANPRTSSLSDGSAYDMWNSFSINSTNFISGLNTLTFDVTNIAQTSGNPMGLRVEFTNSSISPVPEPKTYAMMLAGLVLIGVIAYRRKDDCSGMLMAV